MQEDHLRYGRFSFLRDQASTPASLYSWLAQLGPAQLLVCGLDSLTEDVLIDLDDGHAVVGQGLLHVILSSDDVLSIVVCAVVEVLLHDFLILGGQLVEPCLTADDHVEQVDVARSC